MAEAGKPLSVSVQKHKAKRSSEQNKLLHSIETEIAEQAWIDGKQYSKDSWHGYFAQEFIGYEELPKGGKLYISTASLSVEEMSAHIERIMRYAAEELGIEIEAGRI